MDLSWVPIPERPGPGLTGTSPWNAGMTEACSAGTYGRSHLPACIISVVPDLEQ